MGVLLRVAVTGAIVGGVVVAVGGRTEAGSRAAPVPARPVQTVRSVPPTPRPLPAPASRTAPASRVGPATVTPATVTPATVTPATVTPAAVTRAAAAVRAVDPAAVVGVRVVDRRTGAAAGVGADRPFLSASLVKLLIAIDALQRSADPGLADQVRYMLSYSDDDTASRLWVDDGGPDIVRRTAAEIGLRHTVPPDRPGMWGATRLTADDVARIYTFLLDRLDARPRAVVLAGLRAARRYGSDGFAQHFGIPDAEAGTPHAVKQGWMRYAGSVDLHTSGLVGAGDRYVVVVLTAHPADTSWATARAAVTAAVRALRLSG